MIIAIVDGVLGVVLCEIDQHARLEDADEAALDLSEEGKNRAYFLLCVMRMPFVERKNISST